MWEGLSFRSANLHRGHIWKGIFSHSGGISKKSACSAKKFILFWLNFVAAFLYIAWTCGAIPLASFFYLISSSCFSHFFFCSAGMINSSVAYLKFLTFITLSLNSSIGHSFSNLSASLLVLTIYTSYLSFSQLFLKILWYLWAKFNVNHWSELSRNAATILYLTPD